MKVLILGGTGVIGKQIVSSLFSSNVSVTAVSRGVISNEKNSSKAKFVNIDLVRASQDQLFTLVSDFDYVINAAGVIKQRISSSDISTQIEAINLNSMLPIRLAALIPRNPIKIINITTDCVFDGFQGNYDESDSHSALDIYGKSKSLGEVEAQNVFNLRCSVIGPDSTPLSLAGWVVHQELNAKITGYVNHFWNGITTYSLSKILLGIIQSDFWKSGTHHLVPANSWTKFQLVQELVQVTNRQDLSLVEGLADQGVNRILQTINSEQNSLLWNLGGYSQCPSIDELFQEPLFRSAF